jgi:flagellar biosynthesis/type III secretory pathway protein FliH
MIYRGRLIDAGFLSQNATAAMKNIRKLRPRPDMSKPSKMPDWPPGTPLPPEFEIHLERQQKAAAARAAAAERRAARELEEAERKAAAAAAKAKAKAKGKAKASPKSTARSSRG